jgi:hypothetical protein
MKYSDFLKAIDEVVMGIGDVADRLNTQGLSKSKTEGLNFSVHVAELKKFLDN